MFVWISEETRLLHTLQMLRITENSVDVNLRELQLIAVGWYEVEGF
jgi:hypothetical protein